MTITQLEVGKSYLRSSAKARSQSLGSFNLVKILGLIDEDTREYERGYRFFGDDQQWYTQTGEKIYTPEHWDHHSWNSKPNWNDQRRGNSKDFSLEREAISTDFSEGFSEKLWTSPNDRQNPLKFIPSDDPNFLMKLGGIYISRMGFFHFITEIIHYGDREHVRFGSQRKSFLLTGKSYQNGLSMHDISHQQI